GLRFNLLAKSLISLAEIKLLKIAKNS
ncbi:MAG: hypothetical protein RL677_541, partial [Actinomycetota bacterium]